MARAHADLRPEDITAIVDTREQRPLDLKVPMRKGTLTTGDYSVLGLEHLIAVERKSLADLVMCVSRERERFEREIKRMLAYETRAIVVEASWVEIETQQYRAKVAPAAVIGSIYAWIARGITVDVAGSRERAAKSVSWILFSAARERWRQLQSFHDGLKLAPSPLQPVRAGGEAAEREGA